MFDPYQSWFSSCQLFNSIVVNRPNSFLGMATISLILKIQILSQNSQCVQTNSFYNQFSQLTQFRVPDIYSTHSYDQCASSSEIVKYIKKTPFLSIPLNSPMLISSFSTITPGFEEISTLNYYIIDRFRSARTEYSHLPACIPPSHISKV
ncbi:hypothetical protein CONCODRAFT_3013 [Conidiobolus coronatus NRRL 28638]|uniref:Uncharacterized protein n=1 Tax=Conidiobolus coronatus (strain ATCC 28846 / CBS 209.66 / NRRL 28638) TaxID=796925 RepID=A0A137PG23_CONC2|nr:hypothetical protein CONCODRAFT_3013 [Conidiobolus coronatus NRRL 28638]|eukprot:KXN73944.1 hypothetical protein CONCODRAFT_3013 [Conidiobolus coronatus NRRL 28638]